MKTSSSFFIGMLIMWVICFGCKKSDKNDYYKTDNCLNASCYNGTLDSLSCVCNCNAGYEGDSCITEIREKFLGHYTIHSAYCIQNIVVSDTISEVKVSVDTYNMFTITILSDSTSVLHLRLATKVYLRDSTLIIDESRLAMISDTNSNYLYLPYT